MTMSGRNIGLFALMALLLMSVGFIQSWDVSLTLLNLCIISAIMALGVNIQWGYAGLFNVGTMGFAALGGLAAMLVSVPPVTAAWEAGGAGVVSVCCCQLFDGRRRRRIGLGGWRLGSSGSLGWILLFGLAATKPAAARARGQQHAAEESANDSHC